MLLQNKAGRSLSQGSPLRRNETGKMKTKKSTNYDQYFGLSKRMRFSAKLGNNMRSYLRILTVFRLHMVKILKRPYRFINFSRSFGALLLILLGQK